MRNYTIQGAFELGIRKKSPKTSIYSRSYWIRRSSRGYRQVQFVLSFRHRCGCSEWSDAYSPVPFLTVYFLLITETFHIAQVKRVLHTMYQVFCIESVSWTQEQKQIILALGGLGDGDETDYNIFRAIRGARDEVCGAKRWGGRVWWSHSYQQYGSWYGQICAATVKKEQIKWFSFLKNVKKN